MEPHLKPAVAKIVDDLRARPKGTKKMSARRLLRAFGYERRSRDNVREICEHFQSMHVHLSLSLTDPPTLDEQVLLSLEHLPGEVPPSSGPAHSGSGCGHEHAVRPLPPAGHLAGPGRTIADIIADVEEATVQVFTETSGGSGIIVDPDGLILTCRHVVDAETGLSEREVRVDYADGSHCAGTVVRSHRTLDFALVVVPRCGMPAVPFGEPLRLRDAETLYVVGSPGGLARSVSRGIVSAARRRCETNVEYLQMDAAISPGSSGGPVVTERGDLVGITTWAYREQARELAHGLSFAVPTDYVQDEVAEVRALGLREACRRDYCRHCGWLNTKRARYCCNCGAMFAERILEGSAE